MTGVHYGVHQDQIFYKLYYWFLMKPGKYPKKKFVKFLQYIKKKYCDCFCILLWCKIFIFNTLQGPSHVCHSLFLQHSNCLDFAKSVPACCMLSEVCCIEPIYTGFYISHQNNFHIYIIFHQQCKTIHL